MEVSRCVVERAEASAAEETEEELQGEEARRGEERLLTCTVKPPKKVHDGHGPRERAEMSP